MLLKVKRLATFCHIASNLAESRRLFKSGRDTKATKNKRRTALSSIYIYTNIYLSSTYTDAHRRCRDRCVRREKARKLEIKTKIKIYRRNACIDLIKIKYKYRVCRATRLDCKVNTNAVQYCKIFQKNSWYILGNKSSHL